MFAQPQVTYTVDTAVGAGITAIAPPAPAFERELRAFVEHPRSHLPAVEEIRPYSVILKNTSSEAVSRFSFRWELSYPDRPPTVDLLSVDCRHRLDWSAGFLPGHEYLVFPGLQVVNPGFATGFRDADSVSRRMRNFRQASHVTVILDAVVFSSGLIVGPDKSGLAARCGAERRGLVDLVRELREMRTAGAESEAVRRRLEALRKTRVRPRSIANLWQQEETWYHDMRSQAAMHLLLEQPGQVTLDACINVLEARIGKLKDLHRTGSSRGERTP